LHPSRRRDILSGRSTVQASSVQTIRTFHLDLPLCRDPLNYSSLHPSGGLSNTAKRILVFDKEKDFVPKHRYRKTASAIRTMCVLVRMLSFIKQVVYTKLNGPDISLHGPDAQASNIKIVCISSTVRTSYFMVRTLIALIWKLRAAKVQPSGP
jgi:hypothetical protein